ncbi:MAG: TonB-dependent receptor domain-containing protein [Vibrio sp.]
MDSTNFFPQTLLSKSIVISCAALSAFSYADENLASEQTMDQNAETMVVTASGYQQVVTDAPASISVVTRQDIENNSYRDLTDALRSLPGVIITGGGTRQEISLRGMPSDYTAILVDGRKQSGRQTQVSSGGGFEQDWLPPLSAIERIEVVRGPMSTLYGSDAIGGVINVITRKDYQEWHGSVRTEATLQENDDSGDEYQAEAYLAGPLIDGLLSTSVTAMYQERKEDDILFGNGGKELNNIRGSLYLTPTDSDTFTFDYTHHDQERKNTEGKSRTRSSETNNNRQSFGLAHAGQYQWGNGDTYVSQETVENEGRELEVENTKFNTQWTLPIESHYLTLGASYEHQELDNTDYIFKNSQWSLFAEDEWYLTDSFALTLGLRYDDNEQFDSQFSPRIYGVWTLDPAWTVKGGVSTGYRAPTLTQMEEDWVQESCNGRCNVYGNADLKPETSVNTEMGVYYVGDDSLTSNVTVFYNEFDDKIDSVNIDENCTERTCDSTYINVEDAMTYGAEASVSKYVIESLKLSATYTYTHSEKESGDDEGQPLTQAPEHIATLQGDWAIRDDLNTWFRVEYRGDEKDAITKDSSSVLAPSVTYVDFGGNWRVHKNLKLMAGIYNLFDKDTSYDEYGYVEDGRRYWVGLDASF